jgi:hypothetical protein
MIILIIRQVLWAGDVTSRPFQDGTGRCSLVTSDLRGANNGIAIEKLCLCSTDRHDQCCGMLQHSCREPGIPPTQASS